MQAGGCIGAVAGGECELDLRRRAMRLASLLLALAVVLGGWSFAGTMRLMPRAPLSVQFAEWARTHGLGFLVTEYELILDQFNPPQTGGRPDMRLLAALGRTGTAAGARVAMPTPLLPALPGEGRFRVLRRLGGVPVLQEALVRPDAESSSYLTSVIVMSGTHTRVALHPGTMDPGRPRSFHASAHVSGRNSTGLVGTFNSGFLVQDSQGGFYLNGRLAGRLHQGAASVVTYRDGHTTVGAWGRDLSMSPEVVSVRQNLRLIVNHGRPVTNMDAAVASRFGAAASASFRTWRSGLGVAANGDLIYAIGDALTASSLADVLARAGAVRALQLDINYHSTVYIWYSPGRHGQVSPHMILSPAHGLLTYLGDDSRDFFAVYTR